MRPALFSSGPSCPELVFGGFWGFFFWGGGFFLVLVLGFFVERPSFCKRAFGSPFPSSFQGFTFLRLELTIMLFFLTNGQSPQRLCCGPLFPREAVVRVYVLTTSSDPKFAFTDSSLSPLISVFKFFLSPPFETKHINHFFREAFTGS